MALYFITGSAGSGKSAIAHELRARGYQAYDTDEDALARWQSKSTGYIHPKSSVKPDQRTPEFLAEHEWNVPREYVEELSKKATNKTIFLCGVASNEKHLQDLFAKGFALCIDAPTLTHRLQTRTNNSWGKQPHELQQTLEAHEGIEDYYRRLGYILIDASCPVEEVTDSIVGLI